MEWIERWNQAIQYIEEHLTEEIEYEKLGKIAGCSAYHFQRMFNYMAELSLSEYIRRRKMSLAAADLLSGQEKIIDIALKYGYASPTAFNRAFQSIHGLAPSEARRKKKTVRSYPPISFQIMVKGVERMNYRLEEKEAFTVVGFRQLLKKELEENFKMVPDMWEQLTHDGSLEKLLPMMDQKLKGVMGISSCPPKGEWSYGIAVASGQKPQEGMEQWEVPAHTWAVFEGAGPCPAAIQELERQIFTQWLPTSGYEYDWGPDVEFYTSPDPSQARFQVWVPVKKK